MYSFPYVSFYLKVSNTRFFNETTCAMQLKIAMYSFLQEPFFPLDFRMGFLMRHVHIVVVAPMGSVVKHTDSILEGKEKEGS